MRFPFRAWVIGRLCVTSCNQAQGAPWVDRCWSRTPSGECFAGIAILLTPWRRNRFGETLMQRALVIGWRR